MKLKKTSVLLSILLSSSVFAGATYAYDYPLLITNQTSLTLSFNVNGVCSKIFGPLQSYTFRNISEKDFLDACKDNDSPCAVKVFDKDNCDGEMIAEVDYFIPKKFVHLTSNTTRKISIAVSGFDMYFVEGFPAKK